MVSLIIFTVGIDSPGNRSDDCVAVGQLWYTESGAMRCGGSGNIVLGDDLEGLFKDFPQLDGFV